MAMEPLLLPPDERAKFRRVHTEQAINLARQSKWEEAVEVNQRMVAAFPNDAEALNRLGKALTELGRYGDALEAYERARQCDPTNTIAQKNVARLRTLKEENATPLAQQKYDPALFIEEPGKTAVTTLANVATPEVLAPLAAGDPLTLKVSGSVIEFHDARGLVVGLLEPKLTLRLLPLMHSGNQYVAAVTGTDDHLLRVIIRESYQHPSNTGRVAFPTSAGAEGVRPYMRDSVLRYDLEEEEEDDGEEGDYGFEGEVTEEAEGGEFLEGEEPET